MPVVAFGGDQESITIFGESAGGNSALTHLVQPRSYPARYSRAIVQSGTYAAAVRMTDAQQTFQAVLRNSSCEKKGLDCLLHTDALTVAAALPEGVSVGPVIDGVVLTADPYDLIRAGEYNKHTVSCFVLIISLV